MNDPVTGTTDVDFLRSTTTVTTDREADGDTTVRVRHLARFAVAPNAVADLTVPYGHRRTSVFAPRWLEATWVDGRLYSVDVTGPQRNAGGNLGARTKRIHWNGGREFAEMPALLLASLAAYETAVADTVAGGNA